MADRFKTQLNAIQIAVNQDDFGPQATVVVDSSSGGVIAAVGALELQRTSPKLEEIHSVSGLKAGVASSLDLVVPSSGSALQNYSDFGFTSYIGSKSLKLKVRTENNKINLPNLNSLDFPIRTSKELNV